jgi:hypothetical protein
VLKRDELLHLLAGLNEQQVTRLIELLRSGLLESEQESCPSPGEIAFDEWLLPEEDEAWRHLQQVP